MFDKIFLSASTATDLTLWEKIVEWYQNSFLCELLTYLKDTYFSVNFGAYENFTISETTAETIRLLIPAIGIAMVFACLLTARVRVVQGRFVRRLLRGECLSPDSAKSLAELELFRNAAIRRELSRGSNLRMVVRCVHEDGRDTGVGVYSDRSSEELLKLYEMEEAEKERIRAAKRAAQKAKKKAADKEADELVDEVVDEAVEAVSGEETEPTDALDTAECADAVRDGEVLSEDVTEEASVDTADAQDAEADGSTALAQDAEGAPRGRLPKIDFTTARFYIPKELKHRADVRFERRGSSWAPAIASIALVILMTGVVCWLLPYILTLADGIISLMAPQ
jgi:hypothetical protein